MQDERGETETTPFAEIVHPKKRAFVAAYAQTGNKSLAAEMAAVAKQTIYTSQWREDPEFQAAMERGRVTPKRRPQPFSTRTHLFQDQIMRAPSAGLVGAALSRHVLQSVRA